MAKVELKQPIVQAIAEDVKDAASVVLVDYRGLTVAQDTELRKQLREAGITYKVYKNTMMKRAFEGTDFAVLDEHLEGPSAIAVSKDDATAPARILCKFAKDAKALELKAGVVEGTLYDVDGLTELSKIPSREELLSQGQKQLLCIARIMLCLPPMLILDEATSSIDTMTELRIQRAFENLMKGRTSFIVAHRLSTIQNADVILVMDQGHIIEKGTHEELLAKGGFYANLYNSQFAPT